MRRRALLLAALVVASALPLAAQQHPNQQKGFDPNKLYAFEGVDSINTFNGNLVVTLPIGQRFNGDGNLSYGLTLVYNGHPWDALGDGEYLESIPDRRSNAGMGWLFSLGRLIGPGDETNQTPTTQIHRAFLYETPDGNDLKFAFESNPDPLFVDHAPPNFMRMRRVSVRDREVDFPDGTTQTFRNYGSESDPKWRLVKIADAFTNKVEIAYDDTDSEETWTINEYSGAGVVRTHTIRFLLYFSPTVTHKQKLLSRAELSGFDGEKAVYTFHHDLIELKRASWDNMHLNNSRHPKTVKTWMLKSVTLPTGETWAMKYEGETGNIESTDLYPGWLSKLRLPTGGSIAWTYADRFFPDGSASRIGEEFKVEPRFQRLQQHRETNTGVATRALLDVNGTALGGPWKYTHGAGGLETCEVPWPDGTKPPEPRNFEHQLTATVTDPHGVTTSSYYHTYVQSEIGRCADHQQAWETPYGMPFTRLITDSSGKFLSTEVRTGVTSFFHRGSIDDPRLDPTSLDKVLRSTWVTYEKQLTPHVIAHLEVARRTYFDRDDCGGVPCYSESFNFNWDGRGHFRQTSTGSNFGDKRLSDDEFIAGTSNFSTRFTNFFAPAVNAAVWQLNTFTEKCSVDESTLRTAAVTSCASLQSLNPVTQQYCFATTGFLERVRTLKNGATPGDGDILVRFTSLNGNVASEEYFGGDLQEDMADPYDRGDLKAPPEGCAATINVAPRYSIAHTYSGGTRKTSQYGGTLFRVLDLDIDPGTGLAKFARDSGGVQTQFVYETSGRLKSVISPGVATVDYRFENFDPVKETPAAVEIEQDAGGTLGKTLARYEYDDFGRVVREESLLSADGDDEGTADDRSVRRAHYDILGRKLWVSELETAPGATDPKFKTLFNYDVFGRATTITAPDKTSTSIAYTGNGTRHMTRTVNDATTHEVYDAEGRLWKVKEPSGPTTAENPVGEYVTTTYDYDVNDRLISVDMEGAENEGTQQRFFRYDNRGFLLSERHPEKGTTAVQYSRYDPRGHAWRKSEGPLYGDFDLQFEFDAAERLKLVAKKKSATEVMPVKEMLYPDLADKSKGKLVTATRHNQLDIGDVKVVETFGYNEPGGRVASRTTTVSNAGRTLQTFSQGFSYSPFGQVETLTYPQCVPATACAGSPRITSVTNTFHNGFLTAVQGFGDLTYWPNGLVHTVTHKSQTGSAAGVDTQEIHHGDDTPDDETDGDGMARPRSITFAGFCRGPEIQPAEPGDARQGFGSQVRLSITPPAGATKYEWFEVAANGTLTLLPNQTSEPFHDLLELSSTKRFLVRVHDATCSTDSRVATVEVPCSDVTVRAMPSDQPIKAGFSASFLVDAFSPTGKTLNYQWYEGYHPNTSRKTGNGTNLLVTPPLNARAQYWVRITVAGNDACVIDSPTVEALICHTPVIMTQPQDDIVDISPGQSPPRPTATVVVQGEPPFTYKVYRGETLLVTETTISPELTYTRATLDEGTEAYHITIEACNDLKAQTRTFLLGAKKCREPKFFLYAPQGMIPVHGADNAIEIVAYPEPFADRDNGKFTYQWFRDGQPVENANGSSIFATASDQGATYHVRMTSVDCNTYIDSPGSHLYVYGTCPMRDVKVTPTRVILTAQENALLQAVVNWGGITYQWFKGMPGNTREPRDSVPGRIDQLMVSGGQPAVYWVRATNECEESRDSEAVYVERTNCGPIVIRGLSPNQEIASEQTVELFADITSRPAPSRYAWLYDPSNPTAIVPSNSARISVAPTETTTYWAFAENACGAVAQSAYVTLHVRSCGTSRFTIEPLPVVETDNFTAATLRVESNDPGVTFEWFEGEAGQTNLPTGGRSAVFTAPILSKSTSYWARATTASGCRFDSRTVRVDVCIRPVVKGQEINNANSVRGAAAWIGFSYEGTKLTYQWYRGLPGDTANPILETRALALVRADETTPFWVRASNRCGSDDSPAFWVTICPTIDQEATAEQSRVMPNTTTKLSVRASGGHLKYQWYAGSPQANVKLGTTADIISPPITADTEFWVVVTSGYCERVVGPVPVKLCSEPVILSVLAEKDVAANQPQFISAVVVPSETTETRYLYYEGNSGDEPGSTLLRGPTTTGAHQIAPAQTTNYWIRARRGDVCFADSGTITVRVCIPTIRTDAPPAKLVTAGELVELIVTADGGPLAYQWYAGVPGDLLNSQPVQDPSATTATLKIAVTASSTYWVRVTGTCGTPRDSAGTVVTICDPPRLIGALARPVIERNGGVNLQAAATGTNLTFTWYRGAVGDETNQISTDPAVFVNPRTTTSYWVKIHGMCGVVSAGTLVSVYPIIIEQPREQRITRGTPAVFDIEADADPIAFDWFRVEGNGSAAVGNGTRQLVTPPIVTNTQFFVKLTSGDAIRESDRAMAHVCVAPRIFANQIESDSGAPVTLLAETRDSIGTGHSTFHWYQGESGNTSVSIGETGPANAKAIAPDATTRYWVREQWATCHADSDALEIVVCKPRLTQPAAASGPDANGQFTLSVSAGGTPALTYQWYAGSPGQTNTPVGTGASITITPAAASYWVRVTSGAGAWCHVDSDAVAISVCEPPSITTPPQPRNRHRGEPATTLEVHATGTGLHYQWSEEGVPIGGDAASISVVPQYTTLYMVLVSNGCGSVSSSALVSVYPVITQQPVSSPVTQGSPATLTVAADARPISYQWFRGNPPETSAPVGVDSPSHQTPPLEGAETYWVRITSGNAFTNSEPVTVGVCRKPVAFLDVHTFVSGDPAVIFVRDPNPNGDERYLWYRGTTPGDTVNSTFLQDSGSLPYMSVRPLQTTSYWVREQRTNCYGDSAAVTVPVKIPAIKTHPAGTSGITTPGTAVLLTVEATGTPPLTYQWYLGSAPETGSPIAGETSPSITVTPGSTTSYWVRVSHLDGQQQWWADSNSALVQICSAPAISRQPASPPGVRSGTISGLSIEATGDSLSYQWYLGASGDISNPLTGETAPSLAITVHETNSYWVRVSNPCGAVNSDAALLSVFPEITQQPADMAVDSGSAATLTIVASGRNLHYQWYQMINGAPVMAGTDAPSFITGPVTTQLEYFCVVRSGTAEVESRRATVGLCTGPRLESGPTVSTLVSGCKALSVMPVFEDRGTVTYRWYRGPRGDTSVLISHSQFVEVCPPAEPTPYWCRIRFGEDGCYTDTAAVTLSQ